MTAGNGSHNSPPQVSAGTGPPRWSAVQAAREAGVSRSTIHEALKSGRLQATKDDNGAWRITPDALRDAGFAPGRQTKVHQTSTSTKAGDDAPVPAEVARLRVEVLQVQLDGERRLREVVERQLGDVVHERDLLRRQLEAAPSPVAPVVAQESAPSPTPTPTSDGPATGEQSVWEYVKMRRRRWQARRQG